MVSPQSSGRVEAKYPEDLSLVRLDYREVVLEFRGGVERLLMSEGKLGSEELDAESQVARLLQALRWRISRSPDASVLIVEAVRTMIRGDVLCIRSKQISERTSGSLVDALLLGCLGAVRAQTLRLINSLAQTGDGRKYLLLPGSRVVAALAAAVEPDEHDTRARRHLLGALQKLSFHSVAARRMCALGVMGWVTKTLRGAVTTGELKSRNAALRKTHEGEGVDSRLSEYDAEFREKGYCVAEALVVPEVLEHLAEVFARCESEREEARAARSNPSSGNFWMMDMMKEDPAMIRMCANPVALSVMRAYFGTKEMGYGHSPIVNTMKPVQQAPELTPGSGW